MSQTKKDLIVIGSCLTICILLALVIGSRKAGQLTNEELELSFSISPSSYELTFEVNPDQEQYYRGLMRQTNGWNLSILSCEICARVSKWLTYKPSKYKGVLPYLIHEDPLRHAMISILKEWDELSPVDHIGYYYLQRAARREKISVHEFILSEIKRVERQMQTQKDLNKFDINQLQYIIR